MGTHGKKATRPVRAATAATATDSATVGAISVPPPASAPSLNARAEQRGNLLEGQWLAEQIALHLIATK